MEKIKNGSEFSVEFSQAMDAVESFYEEDNWSGFLDAVKELVAMMMDLADGKILVTDYPIAYPLGDKLIGVTYQDETIGILVQENDVTQQIPMNEEVDKYDLTLLLKRLYLAITDMHFMQRTCPHCGRKVTLSQVVPYSYQCEHCDEDFFVFETNCY